MCSLCTFLIVVILQANKMADHGRPISYWLSSMWYCSTLITFNVVNSSVGHVTSGCPSPTLKHNVAMGYVPTKMAKVGSKVLLSVRGRHVEATVTKMPFVPLQYYYG